MKQKTRIRTLTLSLSALALILTLTITCSMIGCNAERIADATARILDFDDEIEVLEQDIGKAKVILQGVPLTDLRRAELETEVRVKEQALVKKQAAKGKLVKIKEQDEAADGALYDDAGGLIQSVTPFGYGSVGLLGLSLLRGFLQNRARKVVDADRKQEDEARVVIDADRVLRDADHEQLVDDLVIDATRQEKAAEGIVKSIQPLIDKATPEQLALIEAVQSAVEGAKELVDFVQGKLDKGQDIVN
jgi:hypothetical protein